MGARGRVLGRRRLRRPRLRPSAIRQDVGVDLQLLSPSAIPILYSVRVIHRFALVSAALNFTLPREGFEFLTIPVRLTMQVDRRPWMMDGILFVPSPPIHG